MRYVIAVFSLLFSLTSSAQGYVCSASGGSSGFGPFVTLTTTAPLGEVSLQSEYGAYLKWGTAPNSVIWGDSSGVINFGPLVGGVPAGTAFAQSVRAQNLRADNQLQVNSWASITDGFTGVSGTLDLNDSDGVRIAPQVALPTLPCGGDQNTNTRTGTILTIEADSSSDTLVCICRRWGGAYKWQNFDTGAWGTSTTCP